MKWIMQKPLQFEKTCIMLPGRGISAENMMNLAEAIGLMDHLVIAIESDTLEWYPQPNGVNDQDESLIGCEESAILLRNEIDAIAKAWDISYKNIAIIGYSAGGVMTLKLIEKSEDDFGAAVCIAGTILNPDDLNGAMNDTPILVKHNFDDMCFEWNERHIPAKMALREKEYNVNFVEYRFGGHGIGKQEVIAVRSFLRQLDFIKL